MKHLATQETAIVVPDLTTSGRYSSAMTLQ